ncbi:MULTISPECIES: hypothetical protein [Cryobacterium]|uniref:DUF1273 family protein n=1 Tax=Cryobacterium breve TaxID=1259258 RepID=A0ABY2JBP8_9MICO|nr:MULTISPECIES: hypothetical protein [Cryobacterium]TFC91267.1 hypothetical protein E3T20_14715 [Cryobacterium sp. TmT3-12]TFD01039.1 hypothetical protein E3O65_01700 [Cryobacterium breve]
MTNIGVTGHQQIPAQALEYISSGIRTILRGQPRPLVGFSSLAVGADQLFAEEILAEGGELHAVIPSDDYESTFSGEELHKYRRLLAAALSVTRLPRTQPDEAAFDAAGLWIAENSELMVAVWDGAASRGRGGTADAVAHARQLGRQIRVVWPEGVSRD